MTSTWRKLLSLTAMALVLCLPASAPSLAGEPGRSEGVVPFTYAGSHLVKVPVTLNDSLETSFVFDTGIGITLLSERLHRRFGGRLTGSHTGRRMSGQEVTVPLSRVDSIALGGSREAPHQVGVWKMEGFLPDHPDFEGVEGFLSLNFFRERPVTMDPVTGTLTLETEAGLSARAEAGRVVPVRIDEDGPALTLFMMMELPEGRPLEVEIDLGGNILTLDASFMERLGVDPGGEGVREERRRDETGFDYVRHFTRIEGPLHPYGSPGFAQRDLHVMFQDIRYDGLVGRSFMSRWVVTYDLPRSRIILAKP